MTVSLHGSSCCSMLSHGKLQMPRIVHACKVCGHGTQILLHVSLSRWCSANSDIITMIFECIA